MSAFYPLTHPGDYDEAGAVHALQWCAPDISCETSLLDSRQCIHLIRGPDPKDRVLKGLVYIQGCHHQIEIVRKPRKWRVGTLRAPCM